MSHRIRDVLTRRAGWIGVLLTLAAALLVTYGVQTWRLNNVAGHLEAAQARAVASVHATIQEDVRHRIRSLRRRAQQLAQQPAVVDGFRAHGAGAPPTALVAFTVQQPPALRAAAEFYAPDRQLVAWNGFNMPLDGGPEIAALDAGTTRVVQDAGVRWALAVWWPVRHEGAVVGAVRAMQLVRFRAPVQNQFIEDYSLERQWRLQTGYPVDVTWGASADATEGGRLIAGDTVLGRVDVQPPSEAQLLQAERQWFANIAAVWITGLLFGLFAALWVGYRRLGDATPNEGVQPQVVWGFVAVAAAWWGLRYLLIALDVPDRWQTGKAPLAPLFDPTHLASPIGAGVMESTGDLLVTGCFALLFTVGFLDLAARFRVHAGSLSKLWGQIRITTAPKPSLPRFLSIVVVVGAVELGLVHVLASLARRAVLDSTLDFFARTGLLPEPLVLTVLCGLLLITVAIILCGAGVFWIALYALGRYRPSGWRAERLVGIVVLTLAGVLLVAFAGLPQMDIVAVPVVVAYFAAILGVALLGMIQRSGVVRHFTLRSLLPGIIVLTTLLYPMLYQGMDAQRRGRMIDATASFVEGSDPRVIFSLEQVLQRARMSPALQAALPGGAELDDARVDSVATELLQGSLIASLSQYEASLSLLDSTGAFVQGFTTAGRQPALESTVLESAAFETLRGRTVLEGGTATVVDRITDRRQRSQFQYAGLTAVEDTSGTLGGWMLARAEPRSLLPGTGTPYPRVLLPEGLYGNLFADLALAEFRDGVLVRSLGDFERAQLTQEMQTALQGQPSLWRTEAFNGRRYVVHYQRDPDTPDTLVAARMPAVMTFDHLYYLLRLAIAGFCIGGPFYLLGLYLRYRQGVLPAPRVRFRDKMLDAFLVVGSVAVIAIGIVGARVVVQENERAVRNQLRQNLDRVEEALLMEARRGEMLHRVAERVRIDSLARQVGLDVNLYEDGRLVASSRPRLVRDRLIDTRIPAAAYQALHMNGYRFTTTEEQFGAFTYTVGFQALPDEDGVPRYVLAVPTLPEQERIQEERARTLAYLLGALLLLIVVIMVTALFLSNALAQPIARLRAGLEAVGKGRYAQRLPVDTRDEIGELVQTFNQMREQLAESRRRLAQQERELAWREMARQVAHEIKNPLTPMKLSVQHMRRAFQRLRVPELEGPPGGDDDVNRFAALFDRITNTLIEQINTLARIANEFSSFARLPERDMATLDLNDVIREAAALMQEEAEATIELALHDAPLVVRADREELRRIYINLIKNAIQAIPDDRDGHIHIATAVDGETPDAAERVQSRVSDNGVGIPAEQRDKIFQPNFSTKTSGTGLGLAIAQKTVRELGGEIGFRTEPGAGTAFWIDLPLTDQ